MTSAPNGGGPKSKPPTRRALTYGVGAIGVALGTILTAGGQAGVNDGTVRLAIVVFGILATLALIAGLMSSQDDDSSDSEESDASDARNAD
jgi:hypothetical protein